MTRTAFISGGSGGIGGAIVRRLCALGMEVHFSYCGNARSASRLATEFGATPIKLDFAGDWSPPELEPDVLVCAAGVNLSGHDLFETSISELRQTMMVNLESPLRLIRAYAPGMVTRGWGRVVNVNSLWGLSSAPRRSSYAMSKHALRALTVTSALELAGAGVTVNEVCPGAVETGMLRAMAGQAVHLGRASDEEAYLDECAAASPTRRLVGADSVAAVVGFLVSEAAGDVVGQSIAVSGGSEY